MIVEKICEECGVVFSPPRRTSRYCGKLCRDRSRWQSRKVPRGLCAVSGCVRQHQAAGYCAPHYMQHRRQTGKAREPINGYARSRAEYWNVEYEPIIPADVYAADGWICQLCGEPVDPEKFHPHPDSPSIDHVVPMSKGGPHVRSNVQTAHLGCNVRKGNREKVES